MATYEDYDECRALRHAWKRITTETVMHPVDGRVTVLRLKCLRCTMGRRDELDTRGDLLARAYDAPDGYYRTAADEHPTLQELRLRLVERMIKEKVEV